MSIMTDKDYALFSILVSTTQKELHSAMKSYLKKRYDKVLITEKYIVAVGDIPIALVSHMDTVFSAPPKELFYDREKNVVWSPNGLGADDRAGVFAIIKILQSGLRPSVILTTDEEIGGIGADALGQIPCPIPNLKYLIELDRQGNSECVFYCCINADFHNYICQFGFTERIGSFSDISYLMADWKICGVNVSVGYINEHSTNEILYIGNLYDTINKVKKMLIETEIPIFQYEESQNYWFKECDLQEKCCECGQFFMYHELYPVEDEDGSTIYYCPDCLVGKVRWCRYCGEPYRITKKAHKSLCQKCIKKFNQSEIEV